MATSPTFRPPRQRRSAETLDRIVAAAAELLAERGFDDATVEDIVTRAGSSKGSFYARFADKEALLSYLGEGCLDRSKRSWEVDLDPERVRDVPLRAILERFVDRIVSEYRRSSPVLKALFVEARLHPDTDFARMTGELDAHVTAVMERLLRNRAAERTHPTPARAAEYAMLLIDTTAREAILFAGSPPERDPELRRELTRALAGYLGVT
jgi:AcrR family transcriptional regulator